MAHLDQTRIKIRPNKRNKKTEDALASIIMVLTNMFDIIFTCNVKWVQMSSNNRIYHLSNMSE